MADKQQIWVLFRSKKNPDQWFVDPLLPVRIAQDMEAKQTNATDLANEILCGYFKLPYEPRRRRDNWDSGKGYINFKASPELYRVLNMQAAASGRKPMDLARQILAQHYGLSAKSRYLTPA